jgi:hypothetical protein
MEQGAKSREEFRISHFGLFIAFIAFATRGRRSEVRSQNGTHNSKSEIPPYPFPLRPQPFTPRSLLLASSLDPPSSMLQAPLLFQI